MPSPRSRSRRRTVGAFGNPKPKPIGFVAPQRLPQPPAKREGVLTTIDKWLQFTKEIGLLDTARNNHKAVEGALNISRMVWNATAEKTDMDRAAVCAELAKLPGAPGKEEIAKMVDEFIAKKLELYPEEKNKLISPKSRPQFNKDGTFTIMASTIDTKPEGLVKPEGTSL